MGEFVRTVVAVAWKDVVIEWRTKTALLSALVFAILVLAILYFARDPTVVTDAQMAPGALWVTFTFAAMIALNRGFLLERENRALDGMLLTPASRTGIFVGKTLANLCFVGAVETVGFPLFVLFYNVPVLDRLPELVLVTVMATVAFVAIGTLLSAMVVQTRFAELMLPMLLLPFLIPPLVGAVQMTAKILDGQALSAVSGWLKLLGAFDVAFLTLSILLFEATIEE